MITVDADLKEVMQVLDPQILRKAQKSALNRIRSKTATHLSRDVRSVYNIRAGDVKAALERRVSFGTSGENEARLVYSGRRIGLINFGAKFRKVNTRRGPRTGATTKLYKNKARYLTQRGFIAAGRNGNVQIYQRQDPNQKTRLPIQALYGPSVPQMISKPEVLESAQDMVSREYPKELIHQIDYRLSKL